MNIYKNAISSIQVGVEDYTLSNKDAKRAISAVRNIVAGILLLYKEKLCLLSPAHDKELLIKQDISFIYENDELVIKGTGKNTINSFEISKRFKDLNVSVDWKVFNEINQLRNNLEHYYTEISTDAIREIIAKSFVLIRDFMVNELNLTAKEELGDECWSQLIDVHEVYQKEEEDYQAALSEVDWQYDVVKKAIKKFRCSHCQSTLITTEDTDMFYRDIHLSCKSCNAEFLVPDILEECIENHLLQRSIREQIQGGESLFESCFECSKNTFILEDECCLACGYEMQYTECWRCSETLGIEDQYFEGLCGSCRNTWESMLDE